MVVYFCACIKYVYNVYVYIYVYILLVCLHVCMYVCLYFCSSVSLCVSVLCLCVVVIFYLCTSMKRNTTHLRKWEPQKTEDRLNQRNTGICMIEPIGLEQPTWSTIDFVGCYGVPENGAAFLLFPAPRKRSPAAPGVWQTARLQHSSSCKRHHLLFIARWWQKAL